MPKRPRISVTEEEWDEAAADYELGYKHAAQIARELRVSPATVSRQFKRRGCVKACRIAEAVAAIEARLDAEAREKAEAKAAAATNRKETVSKLLDELFDVFAAAEKTGEPLSDHPEITRIGRELEMAVR